MDISSLPKQVWCERRAEGSVKEGYFGSGWQRSAGALSSTNEHRASWRQGVPRRRELREGKRGGFPNPGGFPLLSGKVLIVSKENPRNI